MEIEVGDSSKLVVEKGQRVVFGRGNGFDAADPTVSRRHVLFEFEHTKTGPAILFEVLGRNPVWVRSQRDGGVRVFRRSEKGELAVGDWLCVSGKRPVWFKVNNVGVEVLRAVESESELTEGFPSGFDWGSVDVSGIDPVKEFGFVVMGHEFDQYPKHMICDVNKWNWFLEEPRRESDDDEYEEKKRRSGRRKRKKSEEDDNEEWTVDGEADEELVAKLGKVNKPKYSTRSKARNEPHKKLKDGQSSKQKKTAAVDEEDIEEEDDDEETLGGFIVGEDGMEEEEDPEETDEYEEEEEFVEDDDEDE